MEMRWEEEKHEVVLKKGVKWGDEIVEKLVFRPMTAQDIMDLEIDISGKSMKPGPLLKVAGLLCEHEGGETVIKLLHPVDAMEVVALMGNFFDDGQERKS